MRGHGWKTREHCHFRQNASAGHAGGVNLKERRHGRSPFRIVEAIYPGMTQLDFTGPHTVFSRLPGAEIIVASEPGGADRVRRRPDLRRHAAAGRDRALRPAVRPRRPGGDRGDQRRGVHGRGPAAGGGRALPDLGLHRLADPGAAGLLKGGARPATGPGATCWRCSARSRTPARVVRDGNIITGGGVTAGIDFALVVAAELAGEAFAQACSSASNTPRRRRSTPAGRRPRRRRCWPRRRRGWPS